MAKNWKAERQAQQAALDRMIASRFTGWGGLGSIKAQADDLRRYAEDPAEVEERLRQMYLAAYLSGHPSPDLGPSAAVGASGGQLGAIGMFDPRFRYPDDDGGHW